MDRSDLLNDAERRVWDAFPRGEVVDLGEGAPTEDDFDPDSWPDSRHVRGELVTRLLLGIRDAERGYTARVAIAGARIVGDFSVGGGDVPYALDLDRCWVDSAPEFSGSSSKLVVFYETRLAGFAAMDWEAGGSVAFARCRCDGTVNLDRAHIKGGLEFRGTRMTDSSGEGALVANGLLVEGGISFREEFQATGGVSLLGALVQGQISFHGARLENPDDAAFDGDGIIIDQDLYFREGCVVNGSIRLLGGHIGGQLGFVGGEVNCPEGTMLNADGLSVDQDMFFRDGFTANGEIRLLGVHIGGQLNFSETEVNSLSGAALNADRLIVDQGVVFRNGFKAFGSIRLPGGQIKGQLSFSEAELTAPDSEALNADSLDIEGGAFFRDGFRATGEVRLINAHVGGQIDFGDAVLSNPEAMAIAGEGLHADANVIFGEGFVAVGEINLVGARIRSDLDLAAATLSNPDRLVLDLEALECPRVWVPSNVDGIVDLRRARLGTLDLGASPPRKMVLADLTYSDLDPDPDPPVRRRIAWLRRDPGGFHPQPYEQLALYYRSLGHERDARVVLLSKIRTRRRTLPKTWRGPRWINSILGVGWRAPGWLIDMLSGYGYVPWRAFCWLVIAVAGGAALLRDVTPHSPTGDQTVNALLLALDATIPTAPLGIRDQVVLSGSYFGIALALQILGYAIVLAILPAASRALSRSG